VLRFNFTFFEVNMFLTVVINLTVCTTCAMFLRQPVKLKRQFCHHFLTLILFQISMTFFHRLFFCLYNEGTNGDQCCFRPHWPFILWTKIVKTIFKISLCVCVCSAGERELYSFVITWRWVNNDSMGELSH